MFKHCVILLFILPLASCDRAGSDQTEQSPISATAKQSSVVNQQSQIKVTFNDKTYAFVVYGRCTAEPHYNFWGIQPEFMHTTGRGPRLHLIGGPEETVIKFYQDDQQLLQKVLIGADAVPYQNGQMNIKTEGKNNIDIRVDCRQ